MSTTDIRTADRKQAPLPRDLPFCRNPALEVHRIKASLLLIDPATGASQRLDPLAAGVWYLLKDPTTLNEAIATLRQAFPDHAPSRIQSDMEQLFRQLQAAHMILPEYRKAG